jgi:NitT/TauT family transport system substrate-binding protein
MMTWLRAAFAALLLTGSVHAQPAAAAEIVLAQYGIAATTVPFAVMLDRGLFKKYGLDVDGFIGSNGGGTTIRNMMANGMPFSEVGTPAVLAAVSQGIDLTIVYAATNNMGETSWVVRKDSPIKTIADLRGKKIGYIGPQSATEVASRLIMQRHGLAAGVEFVPTGAQGGAETALDSGAVDAIPLSDPVLTQTAGKYRVLFRVTQELPNFTNGVGVVKTEYAKSNPDAIRRLLAARKEAVEFIYAHPDDAAKIYARVWHSDDATARQTLATLTRLKFWSPGELNARSMDTLEEGYKLVAEDPAHVPDWRKITDASFLPKGRGAK